MRRTALLIGAGSYVLGDGYGDGVVLPTLLEEVREGKLDRILLGVRRPRQAAFHARLADLQHRLGTEVTVEERLLAGPEELAALPLEDALGFVCTPDATHAGYVEALLHAGVPTWVVKPLTGSGAQSARLDALAAALGTPLFVDYHKRFDPSFTRLRGLLREGDLGAPVFLGVQFTQPARLPLVELAAWAKEVDAFQYIGCHFVDLALWLLPDARPLRVSATGLEGRLARAGGPAYDLIHASLDLASAAGRRTRVDLAVGWSDPEGSPAKSHQRLEVICENGRVLVDQKERGFECWDATRTHQVNPHFLQFHLDPSTDRVRVHGYGPESIRRFLSVRENPGLLGQDALPWSRAAVRVDRILDAVHDSLARDGAWVPVGPARECASIPAPQEALQSEL